jgi:5'/3'-nucleotidase
MPHILVTNDDGIESPGLRALVDALDGLGTVSVVAPHQERSGTAQAITLRRPLYCRKAAEREWMVEGTPTDAVILALNQLLAEPPDVVLSGINLGGNMGENVFYSGTLGAATEAAVNHIPAAAISLAWRRPDANAPKNPQVGAPEKEVGTPGTQPAANAPENPRVGAGREYDFAAAARVARGIAEILLEKKVPAGLVLNVNVPYPWAGPPWRVRFTRQSQRLTRNLIERHAASDGRVYYYLNEQRITEPLEPDTDYAAVLAGDASVTPLVVDRTHAPSLNHLSYLAERLESLAR